MEKPSMRGVDDPETSEALAELLKAVAGDREVVNGLIGQFLDSYRDKLDGISAAIAAGNAQELGKNVHQFKGSLSLFCRSEPLVLAQRLTDIAGGNSLADAAATLELLEQEMEQLVNYLQDFMAR